MKLQCFAVLVLLKQCIESNAYKSYIPSPTQNVSIDFPEVDYPTNILETKPFYLTGSGSNAILSAFTEDVQNSFKAIANEKKDDNIVEIKSLKQPSNINITNVTGFKKVNESAVQESDKEIIDPETPLKGETLENKDIDHVNTQSGETTSDVPIDEIVINNSTTAEDLVSENENENESNKDNEYEWIISMLPSNQTEASTVNNTSMESEVPSEHPKELTSTSDTDQGDNFSGENNSSVLKMKTLTLPEFVYHTSKEQNED